VIFDDCLYDQKIISPILISIFRNGLHAGNTDYISSTMRAVRRISGWWKSILAKRRLVRLRVTRELECLPDVGVKYFEARERFNGMVVE
jgi:hypothetical protein